MGGHETDQAVDFETWVASRSAELTRFAYLLAGNETSAEAALRSALVSACASWSRVWRADDPEAAVRQMVVRAYLSPGRESRHALASGGGHVDRGTSNPAVTDAHDDAWRVCVSLAPPQRVAVVLRCYENMTSAQIASVLDCRQMTVDSHLQHAFAALRGVTRRGLAEGQSAHQFRNALVAHARAPLDQPDRVAVVRTDVRRRRRHRVAAVAVVTAVAAVSMAVVVAVLDEPADLTSTQDPWNHPRGWRAESYNGIQLWVPPSWGWGGSPRRTTRGLESCGFVAQSPASVNADTRYAASGPVPGYVGRPIASEGPCPPPALATHVWFGSPLAPGSGRRQTTVRVLGRSPFNITVADRNLAERSMILGSLEPVTTDANGCPGNDVGARQVSSDEQIEPITESNWSLSMCLYAGAGPAGLYYSTLLEDQDAKRAISSIANAPEPGATDGCLVGGSPNTIVLVARTPTGSTVLEVYAGMCSDGPVRLVTGPSVHVLTRDSARVWANDGLALYSGGSSSVRGLNPYLPGS